MPEEQAIHNAVQIKGVYLESFDFFEDNFIWYLQIYYTLPHKKQK